jgi:hypothetical protein
MALLRFQADYPHPHWRGGAGVILLPTHSAGKRVLYIVKDLQSGIVGIQGFVGVILTLLRNARLAEVARTKKIDQTRTTVQSALLQELLSIRENLVNVRDNASGKSLQSFEFTLEPPYVYRTLVKDIGILQADKAQTVIRIYRNLYLCMNLIRGLAKNQDKAVATMEAEKFPYGVSLVADIQGQLDAAIKEQE